MSYLTEVAADSPLAQLRFGEASGLVAADASGNSHPGAYTASGITYGVTGALAGDANKAFSVAGAGGVSLPLDLSAQNKITIEFWVKWPYPSTDQVLIEYTGNGLGAGGFAINNMATPGSSVGPYAGYINRRWRAELGTSHYAEYGGDPSDLNPPRFANPSTPNKWYHVVLELDRTATMNPGVLGSGGYGPASIQIWVNAVLRARTKVGGTTAVGGNFANGTLYIGGRSLTSLMATATFDDLAVYSGLLSQARIDAHYLAGSGLTWIHPGTKVIDIRDIFPNANIWEDLLPSDAPIHASSPGWRENLIAQLGLKTTALGGSGPKRGAQSGQGGDPGHRTLAYWAGTSALYIVPDNQPLVPVAVGVVLENWPAWDRPLDFHATCMAGVPVPDHAIQESSADGNVSIFQPGTNKYWEFWNMYHNPGNEGTGKPGCSGRDYEWFCYSGGHMRDVTLSEGLFEDRFEVDPPHRHYEYYFDGQTATRLPICAGNVTIDEWNAGVINHALHLEVADAWTTFLYPAHSGDGTRDSTWIPEGAWLRIDPTLDLNALYPGTDFNSRKVKALALATQKYGMLITDKTAVGVGIRLRGVFSYSAEGGGVGVADAGSHAWNIERGADGYLREWDIMENFPWGAIQVLDDTWVQARWPPNALVPPPSTLIELLTEDFSAPLDIGKWPTISPGVVIVSGQLQIACTPSYPALMTAPNYSLSSSELVIEVVDVPTGILNGTNAGFKIIGSVSTNCYVQTYTEGSDLVFEWRQADSPAYTRHLVTVPYSATNHRWWKIRKAGSIVYWETSPDGSVWTERSNVDWATSGWALNSLDTVQASIFSGNWQGQTLAPPDNLFIVDNVNVAPSGPPPPPPVPPALAVSTASLSFVGNEGGTSPAPKTVTITNAGGGTLDVTVSDDADWLTVTPSSPTVPVTLSIWPTVAALSAGTYTATVTVAATTSGATGSPKTITVTFTLFPPPPVGSVEEPSKVYAIRSINGERITGWWDLEELGL